jgi:hypothetical protein
MGDEIAAAARAAKTTTGSSLATLRALLRPGFYHKRGSNLPFAAKGRFDPLFPLMNPS